jgi:transcriptional regulator with XRE-family HTH domain
MKLAEKLYKRMIVLGLNQQKLAQKAKVSDSEVSRILRGQSKKPSLDNIFRLARAVGVSVDYLADDQLEADPRTSPDPLSTDESELLTRCRALGYRNSLLLLDAAAILGHDVAIRRLYALEPKPGSEDLTEPSPRGRVFPVGTARGKSFS